jgi:flavin reductase (DIM6/NTAB) family NADH-FMN oxidoreductase RutF
MNKEQLRQVWSQFATGVTLITTLDSNNQVHGMTANALCSISLDPPRALLSVGQQRATHNLVQDTKTFGVNILTADQEAVASYYAREKKDSPPPDGVEFWFTKQGAAILKECLGYMDCRVVEEYIVADHTLFIAEIEESNSYDGSPLIFYQGKYPQLN